MKVSRPRLEESEQIRKEFGCDGMWKTEITIPVTFTVEVFGNKGQSSEEWLTKAIEHGAGLIDIDGVQKSDPCELVKLLTDGSRHTTDSQFRGKVNPELIKRLNQIPEEWHQVAVRFRRANGIRDGDSRQLLW